MQSFQYTPYAYPLAIAALISALLALYMWERRKLPGAKPAAVLMMALFIWSTGYLLEFMGAELTTKLFWAKIQYFGIVVLPLSLFVFALEFSGRQEQITAPRLAALAIIPVITLLLVVSNELHKQVWTVWFIEEINNTLVMHMEHGIAFWVYIGYTYLLLIASTFLIIQTLIRRPRMYRGQMVSILVGIAAPWIGNVISTFVHIHIDLTPFAFTITGIAIAWGIFRHNLLDISPIAYQTVFENMSDAVFILDKQNRIIDVNLTGQKAFDLSSDQVVGKHAREVFKGQADLLDRFQNTMNASEEITVEVDAKVYFYELSIVPLADRQNNTTGRAIVLHDNSDRKQAETVMAEARDQALQANQTKSQFLARISHELRTPLGVIRGYADLLNEPAYGTLSELQAKAVSEIIESNERVSEMVGELLDEARLAAGAVQLEIKEFSPADILKDVEGKLSVLAQKKKITLKTELDPNLPSQVVGDPTRLNQMVANLASNSIKFTQEGGVKIKFYLKSKKQWAMEVTDTGPGIPKEAQESIFEPFRQADNTIVRKFGGTGLGLSIVKHLTALMGGKIHLKSKVDSGSTFTITLPLKIKATQ